MMLAPLLVSLFGIASACFSHEVTLFLRPGHAWLVYPC